MEAIDTRPDSRKLIKRVSTIAHPFRRGQRNSGQGCVLTNTKASGATGGFDYITGRLPTLPHSYPCSTIGAEELNYRVRDGNGWVLLAKVTQKVVTVGTEGTVPLKY